MSEKTLGQIAYEAYHETNIGPAKIMFCAPAWDQLSLGQYELWEAAARAVAERCIEALERTKIDLLYTEKVAVSEGQKAIHELCEVRAALKKEGRE